jgi:hypothetical protein
MIYVWALMQRVNTSTSHERVDCPDKHENEAHCQLGGERAKGHGGTCHIRADEIGDTTRVRVRTQVRAGQRGLEEIELLLRVELDIYKNVGR